MVSGINPPTGPTPSSSGGGGGYLPGIQSLINTLTNDSIALEKGNLTTAELDKILDQVEDVVKQNTALITQQIQDNGLPSSFGLKDIDQLLEALAQVPPNTDNIRSAINVLLETLEEGHY